MGCTDEKSIISRPLKKLERNNSTINNESNNNHNKNVSSKINDKEDKIIQKNIGTEQEQISLPNDIINKNNNDIDDNQENDINENYNEEDNEGQNDGKEEIEENTDDFKDEEDNDEEYNEESDMLREINQYLQSNENPNFNFPEVKDNTFVGKGLKKMKGYISTVPKNELLKKKEEFWSSRVEGDSQVWNFLKEVCELPEGEEENIQAILEANEITPLKNCLNITYDREGVLYEIPNYCINDPVGYDLPEMHLKKPEKKFICFHARKGTTQVKIKTYNTISVDKVKENIAKKFELNVNNIRMFFGGKEMKNGNELWVYNLEDDCVIIIMGS